MAETVADQKSDHRAQRDLLAAYFRAHPYEVVTWETLERLIESPNFMQRISECRTQLGMRELENVPRYAMIDGRRKRITGDYRYRPEALGRDAADLTEFKDQPLFGQPSGWQEPR